MQPAPQMAQHLASYCTSCSPCCCALSPHRSHQECAAKARKVLQDTLEAYILSRDAPKGKRSDAAVAAAKAAAKRAAAAVIAAGGDGRQLDDASAGLLNLVLVPAQLKKLLLPLLRLRQACCHPQVCSSSKLTGSHGYGCGAFWLFPRRDVHKGLSPGLRISQVTVRGLWACSSWRLLEHTDHTSSWHCSAGSISKSG